METVFSTNREDREIGFCPSLEYRELVFLSNLENRALVCSIGDRGVFCSNLEDKVLIFASPIDADVQEELADKFGISATVPVGRLL